MGKHIKRSIKCAVRGKQFLNKSNLLKHIHKERYKCGLCGKQFINKSNLRNHMTNNNVNVLKSLNNAFNCLTHAAHLHGSL